MENKKTLLFKSLIIMSFLLLLLNIDSLAQEIKFNPETNRAVFGFPWKYEQLDKKLQKKAIKLGYNNNDTIYREAAMGKIIPAAKVKKGPAIIIKKITIMNNETVYYGIINHKALSPNEMDEMMELLHEVVSEVWVRISAGGKKIEFCLSSEVPNY